MNTKTVVAGTVGLALGALLVWMVERKPEERNVGPLPVCELVPGTVVMPVAQALVEG